MVRSAVAWHGHLSRDPFARLQLAEGRRDPYRLYAEVRSRGELVPSPTIGFQSASHRLCREVLRDRRVGMPAEAAVARRNSDMSLLELDPPDHTRLRRLAAPAFTPTSARGLPLADRVGGRRVAGRAAPRRTLRPRQRAGLAAADHGDHRPARG